MAIVDNFADKALDIIPHYSMDTLTQAIDETLKNVAELLAACE